MAWDWDPTTRVFSKRGGIKVIGNFDYQNQKIDVPPGAVFVEGAVFCPDRDCGCELATRAKDGLKYCPDCDWGWQEEELS